jgi:hypothetical protein
MPLNRLLPNRRNNILDGGSDVEIDRLQRPLHKNASRRCNPCQTPFPAVTQSSWRNRWRAREKLDITVPIGTPVTSEISL